MKRNPSSELRRGRRGTCARGPARFTALTGVDLAICPRCGGPMIRALSPTTHASCARCVPISTTFRRRFVTMELVGGGSHCGPPRRAGSVRRRTGTRRRTTKQGLVCAARSAGAPVASAPDAGHTPALKRSSTARRSALGRRRPRSPQSLVRQYSTVAGATGRSRTSYGRLFIHSDCDHLRNGHPRPQKG